MKKWKMGLLMMLAVAVAGIGIFAVLENQKNSGLRDAKPVAVVSVEKTDLKASIFASGRVAASEERVIFSDLLTGKIEKVSVKEGDVVKKGQILATISTSDLDDQLKSSQIQLEIAKENLKSLQNSGQTNYDLVLRTAEKAMKDAEKTLNDKTQLYASGAITLLEKDAAASALDRAKTDVENAKRNYENYGKESQIAIAQLNIKAAQTNVNKIAKDKQKKYVKSPIDGVMYKTSAKVGDSVNQATPLFYVSTVNQLEVVSNVSEYDIDSVKIGQKAIVTGDGFEDKYAGEVTYISPVAESVISGQTTETIVKVKVLILDKNTKFKPNFSANIEVETAELSSVITVPYEAIYTDKEGAKTVFLIKENILVRKAIKTGVQGDMVVELIDSDLKSGDQVVLNPTDALKDGDLVKIQGGVKK